MRASVLGATALLMLLLTGNPASGAEQKTREAHPSLELLEFLGEFQTKDGVWFDPTEEEQPNRVSPEEQNHEQTHNRK
ncbi:MAG: hypothetical protein KKE83_02370 [Proteobacteria bacterium]|nr:hypothetical protein [Pseudomonadota bacterium]MBU1546054.1 hypothetical protein [Pseudomonadota bacterium]MBU2618510.1 hypothetical protein [Pseudomonadota bacterium]